LFARFRGKATALSDQFIQIPSLDLVEGIVAEALSALNMIPA
jgi:hypothetical protein